MTKAGDAGHWTLGIRNSLVIGYWLLVISLRFADAAEAAEIGVKAGVGIAGPFGLAKAGAAHGETRFPGTAAQDALDIFPRTSWAAGIRYRTRLVVGRTVDVLAPLGDVAVEIVKAPAIRFLLADQMGLLLGIVGKPGILPQPVARP